MDDTDTLNRFFYNSPSKNGKAGLADVTNFFELYRINVTNIYYYLYSRVRILFTPSETCTNVHFRKKSLSWKLNLMATRCKPPTNPLKLTRKFSSVRLSSSWQPSKRISLGVTASISMALKETLSSAL